MEINKNTVGEHRYYGCGTDGFGYKDSWKGFGNCDTESSKDRDTWGILSRPDIYVFGNQDTCVLGTDNVIDFSDWFRSVCDGGRYSLVSGDDSGSLRAEIIRDIDIEYYDALEKKVLVCKFKMYDTLHLVMFSNLMAEVIYYRDKDYEKRALVKLMFDEFKLGASRFTVGDKATIDSIAWNIMVKEDVSGATGCGRRYQTKYMIDTILDFDSTVDIDKSNAAFKDIIIKFVKIVTGIYNSTH